MTRPVVLTTANLAKLNVREWGLPSGIFPGKAWRSELRRTVTMLVPIDADHSRVETRAVLIADRPEQQWLPQTWLRAMEIYRRDWPHSAPRFYRVPGMPAPVRRRRA